MSSPISGLNCWKISNYRKISAILCNMCECPFPFVCNRHWVLEFCLYVCLGVFLAFMCHVQTWWTSPWFYFQETWVNGPVRIEDTWMKFRVLYLCEDFRSKIQIFTNRNPVMVFLSLYPLIFDSLSMLLLLRRMPLRYEVSLIYYKSDGLAYHLSCSDDVQWISWLYWDFFLSFG